MDLTMDQEAGSYVVVKLQTEGFEVNVRGVAEEFLGLDRIRVASWKDRRSIQAGRCADSLVHWSFDGEAAFLAVGTDDEVWDVGLAVPLAVVDEIAQVARTFVER